MDKANDVEKFIYDLLQNNPPEESVPAIIKYLKLSFANGQVLFPSDSPARKLDLLDLMKVYCKASAFFHYYGPQENAFCLYREVSRMTKSLPLKWKHYSFALFIAHYMFLDKDAYFQMHIEYNRLFKDVWQFSHNKDTHRRHKKIRLGYLSGDFARHVCLLFIWCMLTKYDRDKFEVYCFFYGSKKDDVTQEVKKHVDVWVDLSDCNIPQAAKEIYMREIDILFELAGHGHETLPIMAYKPAPVQICGIGYFATTGLKTVDYFLTDKYLMQDGGGRYFVETPLVMPRTHFCFSPINAMPKEVKGAPCKKNGYVTFGSFCDPVKVNDVVLQAWQRILSKVPGSKLLLKGRLFNHQWSRKKFIEKLKKDGIAVDRVTMQGFSMPYLHDYWDMDIALDTFPYPGGGTTCDALYMGVPVITLGDGSHGGNFGISLLMNIGLEECCTYSVDEYVDRAVMLASDMELLDALHLGLRNMMEKSPVRDEHGYMKDLECKYIDIWHKYLQDEA